MPSPVHSFPRLKVWGPVLLGVLIVLTGTLLYLQTRHGFRHVVVPLVQLFVPGTLEIRDGIVGLPGRVELEGLRYIDRQAGVELFAERALTVVSLPSLVGGGPPVIHVLEVRDATLALTLAEQEVEPPEADAVPDGARAAVLLPLVVEQGRVEDLDVSIRSGGTTTTVNQVALAVEELAPGEGNRLTLSTSWRYHDAGSGDSWSGSADAGMTVNRAPAGDALAWSGTASVDLREAPTLPPAGEPVSLTQAVEGSYDQASGALRATSSLQVEQGGAALASAQSEVALAEEASGRTLAASLTINRLTAAALNLVLAGQAEARFETAEVKGRIDVRGAGNRMTVQSSVEGAGIRLRPQGTSQATPPVAVSIQQAALWDRATHAITLETLDATVSDRTRAVLVASLDHPLTMRLDRVLAEQEAADPTAETAELSVTLHELTVEQIRPWLALTGSHQLDEIRNGSFQGRVTATVRRQAETVEIEGGLRADRLMIRTPGSRSPLGPLRLEQELRATLTNLETLQVDECDTTITVKNRSAGKMRAVVTARVHPAVTVRTLSARLTLDELPAEMLNPLLDGAGGTRIARARLSGMTRVDVTEEGIVWKASYQGRDIALTIPDASRSTAPVDVHLEQSGRFDRGRSQLTVPTLNVKVLENRRVVLEGTLEQPLTLDLARSAEEKETAPALQAKPVRFKLEIRRLSVEQLRPRLALLGSRLLDDVQSGVLDGRLKIDVLGQGERVVIAGQLDASDVRMRDVVSRPLAFRSSLEGSVAEATRGEVKSLVVRVMAGPKELFLFQAAGSVDAGRGAVNMTGHAFSVDVTKALQRVGWLGQRAARVGKGGELSAKVQVVTHGADQPVAVTGEAEIDALRTVVAGGKTLTRTLHARVDLGVNGERTLVSMDKLEVGVMDKGRSEGSLSVTGQWPLVGAESPPGRHAPPPPGRVVVRAKELDGGPLVLLLDLLPGRAPGRLPVSIDATVSHDPVSRVTQVRGRETLGPLSLAGRQATSGPTTVHLEHDVRVRGEDDLEVSQFTLTSERRRSAADRVDLNGRLRLGAHPQLKLRGEVAQLDAAWYADLVSTREDGEGAPGKTTGETGTGGNGSKGHAVPVVLPLELDLDASIGTITYRTIVIGKGRLKGTGNGERAALTLEPTGLAGGTVRGALTLTLKDRTPHVSWSAEGRDIGLGPIFQAFQRAEGPALKGRATFTTAGTGRGRGAALKRSLSGTAVLDITEGEFVKSRLMRFIAKETGIRQFESFGFRTVHGEFKIAEGWVHVTQLRAQGPGLALKGDGKIGLDGQLDATVVPSVAGELAEHAKRLCVAPLLRTVDDLTQFPVAVRITGTFEKPEFSARLMVDKAVSEGVGGLPLNLLETLKECGNLPKVGKQLGEGGLDVLKGAGKLFKGLLGGEKQKDKNAQPGK